MTNCIRVNIVPGTEAKFILKMSFVSSFSCRSGSFFINSLVKHQGKNNIVNQQLANSKSLCLTEKNRIHRRYYSYTKYVDTKKLLRRDSTPRQAKIYSVKRIKARVENIALCEVRSPYTSLQTVPRCQGSPRHTQGTSHCIRLHLHQTVC